MMTKQLLIIFSFAFIVVGCGKKTDCQNKMEQTTEESQEVEVAEEKEPATVYGVDLGLSVNWEECNVDASKPSDVGSEGNYWCTSDDYFNMMSFHMTPVRAQMMIIDYNYLLAARRVHDK